METFIINIKDFFYHLNGSLTIKKHEIPDELKDVYEVINNLDYDHPASDKINLHSDVKNVGNDFKKAKSEYELTHG